ncbi:MAG TPA: GNAT family N-acetyltransferase [Acetobacteraceae bacterium]|jgi:acetyltransferase|nr:GNAT family N-acetyltransferase [Acetobacteraceae bacterium]
MTVPRLNTTGRFDPACLFRPGSIAVIGADSEAGGQIAANLSLSGYKGEVQAIRDAAQLTGTPQLAVLAVPPDQVGPSMTLLAEANCFAAIVPGAADDLAAHAERTGVRVLGAHSFGIAVPRLNLNASRAHIPPPPGRLALISQSSALSRAVIDWAAPNGVGFSHIVGLGANADIGFGMTLDWLSRDPDTGAILLDIRRIKNHRLFLSAARAAAKLRPVVAIRAGLRLLDEDGAADLSFEAALRRAGVLSVKRLEDLLAAAETLSRAKPAKCDTLAIVSNAIGPGRLAADSVLREGLRLMPDEAPDHGILHVASSDLAATAFTLAARPNIGGVLVVHAPQGQADEATIESLCHPPNDLRAPLLICAMGETTGAMHRAMLAHSGLPVFGTPDQAVQGFEHLVRDRRNRQAARELPSSKVLTVAPEREWVRRRFERARAEGHLAFNQDEALEILAAYGVPAIPTRFAASPADAGPAADLLGYPAVVKLRDTAAPADRLPGSLVFDLHDAPQIVAASRLLCAQAERRGGTGELLVQRHAGRGREVAIRVADDTTFGPTIAFGGGGTLSNPTDMAVDLPPLNLALAHGLIQRSRTGATLGKSLRDRPPANAEAVAQVLVRISQLIVDFPEIAVLDIPSLFVDADGVLAADAWLRLRGPDEKAVRLAIAPYPSELIEHRMVGGEMMTIRPIRPEDAQAHTAFFGRLSPQDIRYRFFSAMRELSPEQTVRLTQVDYDREMAFIAVREATGETVGVSRLAVDSDGRSGEFAVIVQADLKGRGLASRLMRRLIEWGRQCGLRQIEGQILADNQPMLAFIKHLGFTVHRMADDPEVMEAKLALG